MSQHSADEGMGDLRGVLGIFRRHKILVLLPVVAGVTAGAVLALLSPPAFTATSVVVAAAPKVRAIDFDGTSAEGPDGARLRSEIDVIGSQLIASRVADRLHKELPTSALVPEAPKAWDLMDRFGALTGIRMPKADGGGTIVRHPSAAELSGRVRVANDGRSYTIFISYTSPNPVLSAAVANAFAEEYLGHQVETKAEGARSASDWLASRLKDLRGDLEGSELALERFKATHGLVGDRQTTKETAELTVLRDQVSQVRRERVEVEAHLQALRDAMFSGTDLASVAETMRSEVLVTLRKQQAELEQQLTALLQRSTDRHPEVAPLRDRLETLTRQVQDEVVRVVARLEADAAVLEAREAALADLVAAGQRGQWEEDTVVVRLQQLQREADANRAIYETFLTRYKEVIEEARIQQPDAGIISMAQPPSLPNESKLGPLLIIGLFGGSVIGAALAWMRDHLARPLKPEEAESVTGLPVIGLLPNVRGRRRRGPEDLVARQPFSAYAESLRAIHMAMRRSAELPLLGERGGPKVVMVTSALPREGKSSLCLSLARVLGRDGLRVLLLDTDLRASRLSAAIGRSRDPDLLDVLKGEVPVDKALRVDQASGCHYLGSRRGCANPQAVLGSDRFRELVAAARRQYDLVILDTPPVTVATDAAMVGELADLRLFVVRGNSTGRDVALAGLRILTLCRVKADGLILSRVDGLRNYPQVSTRYYGGGREIVPLTTGAGRDFFA